jgi:hypothetical protein
MPEIVKTPPMMAQRFTKKSINDSSESLILTITGESSKLKMLNTKNLLEIKGWIVINILGLIS